MVLECGWKPKYPERTQGEYANSIPEHPDPELNPGPSCSEATAPTTAPPILMIAGDAHTIISTTAQKRPDLKQVPCIITH